MIVISCTGTPQGHLYLFASIQKFVSNWIQWAGWYRKLPARQPGNLFHTEKWAFIVRVALYPLPQCVCSCSYFAAMARSGYVSRDPLWLGPSVEHSVFMGHRKKTIHGGRVEINTSSVGRSAASAKTWHMSLLGCEDEFLKIIVLLIVLSVA